MLHNNTIPSWKVTFEFLFLNRWCSVATATAHTRFEEESLMTDLMSSKFSISYFNIQNLLIKLKQNFLNLNWKYFQRSFKKILYLGQVTYLDMEKSGMVRRSKSSGGDIWLVCKQLFSSGSLGWQDWLWQMSVDICRKLAICLLESAWKIILLVWAECQPGVWLLSLIGIYS